MKFSRTSRRPRAFTLIEVLLAVVIFAMVLAAINAVFYGALRLRNKTTESLQEALPRQQACAALQRDLASLVPPGGKLSGTLSSTPTVNSLTGQVGPEFFTASGLLDETLPWGEVQRVSYLLTDSANRAAGKDLIRAVARNLLPTTSGEPPVRQWLMSGVQGMTFQFHDGNQWRDAWDSTTADLTTGLTNVLPKAIKVRIQLASLAGSLASATAPIELVVPVFVQSRTN